jgi:hypothetical protein
MGLPLGIEPNIQPPTKVNDMLTMSLLWLAPISISDVHVNYNNRVC